MASPTLTTEQTSKMLVGHSLTQSALSKESRIATTCPT